MERQTRSGIEMEIELKDYEFGVDEQELHHELSTYRAIIRNTVDEAWLYVVAGVALDHGFAHRRIVKDC